MIGQESGPQLWGGSVAFTSDYRVRGLSQTRGQPAVQGGFHRQEPSGLAVGVWASTVDRNRGPGAKLELDVYAALSWMLAQEWDASVTYTHYWYPADPAPVRYDYDEVSGSIAYRAQLFATIAYSPNRAYFARYVGGYYRRGATVAYEMTGLRPITTNIALTAGVGYNDLSRLFEVGYWYWNAGISCTLGPVQLDVSRIDSDASAQRLFGVVATEAGWSALISWRF